MAITVPVRLCRGPLRPTRGLFLLLAVLAFLSPCHAAGKKRGHRPPGKPEFKYKCYVMEDAEDGDTKGWSLFDADPPGDAVNAADPHDRENRVIQLRVYDTGYLCAFERPETRGIVLQWRQCIEGNWLMYANCLTSQGHISVRYIPGTTNGVQVQDPIIATGLDPGDGTWVTLRRNLLADLRRVHPRIELQSVTGFMARGKGCVDDIRLYDYTDEDLDVVPDEYELKHKLDPEDPGDASARVIERIIDLSPWGDDEQQTAEKEEPGEAKKAAAPTLDKAPATPAALSRADSDGGALDAEAPVQLTDAEKAQLRQELMRRCDEYVAQAKPPAAGSKCRFRLRTGMTIAGALEELTSDRVRVRTDRGSMAFPLAQIDPADLPELSPKAWARQKALADADLLCRQILARRGQDGDEPPAATTATTASAPETTAATAAARTDGGGGRPEKDAEAVKPAVASLARDPFYEPANAPTPVWLQPTVSLFSGWLDGYQDYGGTKLAERLYAKDQSGRSVLYIGTSGSFAAQDYESRLKTACECRRKWARCCADTDAASADKAFLVLVDGSGGVVGGSDPRDASEIWVAPK